MVGRVYRCLAFVAFLSTTQAEARSALFELKSASFEQPQRTNKVTLAGSLGFPGFAGMAISYWPLGWLSAEGMVEYGTAWFGTLGFALHAPIFAHSVFRHDVVVVVRGGALTWGTVIYPHQGEYWSAEAGYGFLAKNLDVRVLVGMNLAWDPKEPDRVWGAKPTLGVRIGWAV